MSHSISTCIVDSDSVGWLKCELLVGLSSVRGASSYRSCKWERVRVTSVIDGDCVCLYIIVLAVSVVHSHAKVKLRIVHILVVVRSIIGSFHTVSEVMHCAYVNRDITQPVVSTDYSRRCHRRASSPLLSENRYVLAFLQNFEKVDNVSTGIFGKGESNHLLASWCGCCNCRDCVCYVAQGIWRVQGNIVTPAIVAEIHLKARVKRIDPLLPLYESKVVRPRFVKWRQMCVCCLNIYCRLVRKCCYRSDPRVWGFDGVRNPGTVFVKSYPVFIYEELDLMIIVLTIYISITTSRNWWPNALCWRHRNYPCKILTGWIASCREYGWAALVAESHSECLGELVACPNIHCVGSERVGHWLY